MFFKLAWVKRIFLGENCIVNIAVLLISNFEINKIKNNRLLANSVTLFSKPCAPVYTLLSARL